MRRAVLIAAALTLSACATPDEPPHGHDHGGEGRRRGPPSLFISPSGQPFRAGPDQPYPVAVWFAQADKNGDGRLDRTEFRADAEAFFHQLDQNQDGVLDSFEVDRYEREVAPEILGAHGGGGQGGGPPSSGSGGQGTGGGGRHGGGRRSGSGASGGSRPAAGGGESPQGAAPYELLNEPEPVLTADTALDGRITLKEFLDNADRNFDLLDKTSHGYLTLDTLPNTPVQQQATTPAKSGSP